MASFTEGKKLSSSNPSPIKLTVEVPDIDIVRRKLGDMHSRAPSVLMNALNTSLTEINKKLSLDAKKRYTYKKAKGQPRIMGIKKRAKRTDLTVSLTYSGEPIPLAKFTYKIGRYGKPRNSLVKQLAVKLEKQGGFEAIPRAFVRNIKEGESIVRRKGNKRFPIARLYGPSESTMISTVWNEHEMQRSAKKILQKKLDEQIQKQYLKKWKEKLT